MNNYLIPADTKKGSLIMGLFRPFDLILFGVGIFITLILLMALDLSSTLIAFIALSPALITGFLVMPIPYYHNMLTVITELFAFLTNRQRFYWKGWCITDEREESKKNN